MDSDDKPHGARLEKMASYLRAAREFEQEAATMPVRAARGIGGAISSDLFKWIAGTVIIPASVAAGSAALAFQQLRSDVSVIRRDLENVESRIASSEKAGTLSVVELAQLRQRLEFIEYRIHSLEKLRGQ